jgi:hypothetical protein
MISAGQAEVRPQPLVPLDTASGEARSRPISSRGREGPPTDFETGLPAWGGRIRTQKCRRKLSL